MGASYRFAFTLVGCKNASQWNGHESAHYKLVCVHATRRQIHSIHWHWGLWIFQENTQGNSWCMDSLWHRIECVLMWWSLPNVKSEFWDGVWKHTQRKSWLMDSLWHGQRRGPAPIMRSLITLSSLWRRFFSQSCVWSPCDFFKQYPHYCFCRHLDLYNLQFIT